MATFVLVHGGFAGGWTWRELAGLLRQGGHEVYTPTLTGLGERVHLATPETGLETHIQDILNVIQFEELHEIMLVGYSYGGMVVTGVADRVPDRIRHLIYVEGDLPRDGESVATTNGAEAWAEWTSLFDEDGFRVRLRPSGQLSPKEARVRERYVGHPKRCFEEPISLEMPPEDRPFKRTYIAATNTAEPVSVSRTRNNSAWSFHEINSGHAIYREAPVELAAILLRLD